MPPLEGLTVLQTMIYLVDTSLWAFLWYVFTNGGWILVYIALYIGAFELQRHLKVHRYLHRFKWVFLAIDVPKQDEKIPAQTPRAVENIFVHLAGAHGTRDLIEKFWDGEIQRWFSFELVSMEGYIQYVVVTEQKHRDLVEALLYAQYPEAEITEIDDYAAWAPTHYPNPEYKAWGVEWKLSDHYYYSIRTWPDFEDKVTGDYKDPIAATLETLSRIGPGEYAWLQVLVRPIGQKWKDEGIEKINEIQGRAEHHQHWFLKIIALPFHFLHVLLQYVMTNVVPEPGEHGDGSLEYGALAMRPTDVGTIKGIGEKITRIGFHSKIRFVYIAKHEAFNKNKVHHGIIGAMKQYTDETGNSLKPDTKHAQTTAHYLFKDKRKDWKRSEIVHQYKERNIWSGTPRYVLNVRELASIWHFPMQSVKVPTLKRAEAKTSRPPVGLPFAQNFALEGAGSKKQTPSIPIGEHMLKSSIIPTSVTYGDVELTGSLTNINKTRTSIAAKQAEQDEHGDGEPSKHHSTPSKQNTPPPNLPFE